MALITSATRHYAGLLIDILEIELKIPTLICIISDLCLKSGNSHFIGS